MGRHAAAFGVAAAAAAIIGACGGTDSEPASGPLAAVREIDVEGNDHVLGDVDYVTAPPVGGDHFGAWQNCGFYTEAVIDEVAVHSLEHGAVWVAYAADTDAATLAAIEARADAESHVLASPHPTVPTGLVLSAWERQLTVDTWSDPAVEAFLDRYLGRRSPTAPEAGATCQGAIGVPPDDPDRNYDSALNSLMDESG